MFLSFYAFSNAIPPPPFLDFHPPLTVIKLTFGAKEVELSQCGVTISGVCMFLGGGLFPFLQWEDVNKNGKGVGDLLVPVLHLLPEW